MKPKLLLLLLIPLIVFTSILSYFVIDKATLENVYYVPLSVKVDDTFGLNADPDILNFGRLLPGTAGQRSMILENNGSYPITVHIQNTELVGSWLQLSGNDFRIDSMSSQQVNYTVHVPKDVTFKQYNGTSIIVFRKPLFS